LSEELAGKRERMVDAVRRVITHRERAPRSPRMERAFKRLIWRYTMTEPSGQENGDAEE
jgi:hypothetical protein